MDNEPCLSKKTSFSSFYNLQEETAEEKYRKAAAKGPKRVSRPKKQDSLTNMLCRRPSRPLTAVSRSLKQRL